MEWEVGGGIGMGNACKSTADSFQCMTKSTTIKKNKKKKKNKKLLFQFGIKYEVFQESVQKFSIMAKGKYFNFRKFNFRFPEKLRLSVQLKHSPNL